MSKDTKGVITLEACVTVLSFMILMLMLSSLFIMFMAQNTTAHVVLQSAQSLSMDVYSIEKNTLEKDKATSVEHEFGQLINRVMGKPDKNTNFISVDRWYESDRTVIAETVKDRFVGYLSAGDVNEADRLLKRLRVIDGLDGMDFSESYIENETLYVVVKYKLVYDFKFLSDREFPVKQTVCARLWKH